MQLSQVTQSSAGNIRFIIEQRPTLQADTADALSSRSNRGRNRKPKTTLTITRTSIPPPQTTTAFPIQPSHTFACVESRYFPKAAGNCYIDVDCRAVRLNKFSLTHTEESRAQEHHAAEHRRSLSDWKDK
ncbi:hypothetical protein BDU57DRAFT_147755 [Ampelomyces quisqualis]|uniref:Uncharacterized protein n=1 Tax=Ampelomyces quisqualis TaxID=50730 RepID=A0A6A5QXF8_AMPQU|nr:hypothetical protein BDU57DRAFT_147755 [Ampelomyces quisqualis]